MSTVVDDLMALHDKAAAAWHANQSSRVVAAYDDGLERKALRAALKSALKASEWAGYARWRSEPEQAAEPVARPVPFFNRRAVEREIESSEHPPIGSLRFNDSKERVTLPGGTLRRMLQIIDMLSSASPPKREPLNFDQLQSVMSSHFGAHDLTDDEKDSAEAFARAIERAHGIGDE